MRPDCITAIEKALRQSLRKGEADAIENALLRALRQLARKDHAAWRAMSLRERLEQAAPMASALLLASAVGRARRLELQIAAEAVKWRGAA